MRKTANLLRRDCDFRRFHPKARRPDAAPCGERPRRAKNLAGSPRVALPAANPQHCEVPTEHSFPGELPDLRRLALVLESLPDEALLARLAERRGRGRYPVRVAGDHRHASARAVAGSGTQPQPGARCAASARWTTRTSRRSRSTMTAQQFPLRWPPLAGIAGYSSVNSIFTAMFAIIRPLG